MHAIHQEMLATFSASVSRLVSHTFDTGCEVIRATGGDAAKAKYAAALLESGWKSSRPVPAYTSTAASVRECTPLATPNPAVVARESSRAVPGGFPHAAPV